MDSPVPKRLKEARLAAKISQKKLGIAAGMDEFSASARMNHYELGRHTPDYSTLKRIADVLDIPPAYFYADNDQLAEVIKIFGRSNYDKQEKFYKMIIHNMSFKEEC
ncbi:helix-turn-helix domain-containing protein [Legionella sainthelensi]|uniref:helix-turn-helix domain-containing protein n=1 Tax=Legionella sainthelensi TaxID=28087 RepID=UPI000E1FD187|nr:helix-turn-helix transcriptional regulator [Legionella sainthelensi]